MVTIGPTSDVDLAVEPEAARAVVQHLIQQGLQPSTGPGEQGFTWERDGLKVQLMTPPGPPRMRSAGEPRLPVQAALTVVARNQIPVAFVDTPDLRQFRCATPGALVVLKSAAFGRTSSTGAPIDRDAHDVVQLLVSSRDGLLAEAAGDVTIRAKLRQVAEQLDSDPGVRDAAAREHVALRFAGSLREAQLAVRRVATAFGRDLQAAAQGGTAR